MGDDVRVTLNKESEVTLRDPLAWLSLVVAIVAVVISGAVGIFTYLSNSSIGKVQPLQPSGYTIIRASGESRGPSDRLVLPLAWKSDSGKSVLISRPRLILHELDQNGDRNGSKKYFLLEGEYDGTSAQALSVTPEYKNSLTLEPHSVNTNLLVFRVQDFWDESSENYEFQFHHDRDYHMEVEFLQTPGERENVWEEEEQRRVEPLFEQRKFDVNLSVTELRPGEHSYYSIDELDGKV